MSDYGDYDDFDDDLNYFYVEDEYPLAVSSLKSAFGQFI